MTSRHACCAVLAVCGLGLLLVASSGCAGPCDKACARVVEQCGQRVESYSAAPDGVSWRGCRAVEPGAELDLAICLEQCQDWKAEGAECLVALSCGEDASSSQAPIAACLDGRNRDNSERDSGDPSDCRADCDRQADACGKACVTSPGDAPTCGGCFDNCDKTRARCRGWCGLIGQ